MEKEYIVVDGTYYHKETKSEVIALLEKARKNNWRLAIEYGDVATGRPWGDECKGYIGRSMGPVKIPLIIHNRRSFGGPGLLESCIVSIRHANKRNGGELFRIK